MYIRLSLQSVWWKSRDYLASKNGLPVWYISDYCNVNMVFLCWINSSAQLHIHWLTHSLRHISSGVLHLWWFGPKLALVVIYGLLIDEYWFSTIILRGFSTYPPLSAAVQWVRRDSFSLGPSCAQRRPLLDIICSFYHCDGDRPFIHTLSHLPLPPSGKQREFWPRWLSPAPPHVFGAVFTAQFRSKG